MIPLVLLLGFLSPPLSAQVNISTSPIKPIPQKPSSLWNLDQLIRIDNIETMIRELQNGKATITGSPNYISSVTFSTATFSQITVGYGTSLTTVTNAANLQMVANSTIGYRSTIAISSIGATVPGLFMAAPNGGVYGVAINTNTVPSGIPLYVVGQIRSAYDPITNGGGQEVMVSKSGKLWDWTAGTSDNNNAFVMTESGILETLRCIPSVSGNARCGVQLTSPGYAWDVTGDVNTTGVYRNGATAGTTNTCSTGQFLGAITTKGGIITGGSCSAPYVAKTGDTMTGMLLMSASSITLTGTAGQIISQGSATIQSTAGLSVNGPISASSEVITGQSIIQSSATIQGASGFSVIYGISAGSITLSGFGQFQSRTILQLNASTPTATGQTFFCSNCSPSKLVISTGTGLGNYADAVGGQFQ